MQRILIFCFIGLFSGLCFSLTAQWKIVLTEIPSQTPSNETIYIAGNFNQWNPGNPDYKLQKDAQGRWNITLNLNPGAYQFKFTRGSWATVEGNAEGKVISNRTYNHTGGARTTELKIEGWEDLSGTPPSTASPQVYVLSETFPMPQLNTSRRVWLYLPKDYHTSQKTYPVIYMHDGQNLFDKSTSFLNEWRVDESLDSLYSLGDYGCIVVAIDNGGASRLAEYTPWPNPQYGGGKGDIYLQFITESLKPYIDSVYRTKKESRFTAIAGSSLGGLISHYAGLVYPETFGKIGSLSSSFWFSPKIYREVTLRGVGEESAYYLSTGTNESSGQVFDVQRMGDTLRLAGLAEKDLNVAIIQGGKHEEALWAREFPIMYQWFWQEEDLSYADNMAKEAPFRIFRSNDTINVQGDVSSGYSFILSTSDGKMILSGPLAGSIPLESYTPGGLHIFTILSGNQPVQSVTLP